ncbi:MAG: hypothetical protein K2X69_10620 [Silvanigrellaceae bacterium]|nr:hypothetical protein [Silvanigrellaceae bacterium]
MTMQDPKLENIRNKINEFEPKWTQFYSQNHKGGLSTASNFSNIDDINNSLNEIIQIIKYNIFEDVFKELSLKLKEEIESNVINLTTINTNSSEQDKLNNISNNLISLIKNFHYYGIYFRCKYFKNENDLINNINNFKTKMKNIENIENKYKDIECKIHNLLGEGKIKSIADSYIKAANKIKPMNWFRLVLALVLILVVFEFCLFNSNIIDLNKLKAENISLFQLELYSSIIKLSLSIPLVFLIRFCWSQYTFNRDLKASYSLKAAVAESTPSILTQLEGKSCEETIKEVFKTIYSDNSKQSKNDDFKLKEFLESKALKELLSLIKDFKK